MQNNYQIWRTGDVAPEDGFSYFRDAVCEAFMELTPSSTQPTKFHAEVASRQINLARINRVNGSCHSVSRSGSQVSRLAEDCYYLNIQFKARSVITQGENTIVLNPGQIGFFDGTLPFGVDHPDGDEVSLTSIQLPHSIIEHAARVQDVDPKRFCGTRISDHPVMGHLASTTMRYLAQQSNLISTTESQVLLDNLAQLAVASCAGVNSQGKHSDEIRRPALWLAIVNYIEQNLGNNRLSPGTTANQFGITPRYLHKLFEETGMSFSQYVRELRLDRIYSDLRNPEIAHLNITQIALLHGFGDLSSFNKRFKEHYGCTPREVRSRFNS